jgi:hypothetical protein
MAWKAIEFLAGLRLRPILIAALFYRREGLR